MSPGRGKLIFLASVCSPFHTIKHFVYVHFWHFDMNECKLCAKNVIPAPCHNNMMGFQNVVLFNMKAKKSISEPYSSYCMPRCHVQYYISWSSRIYIGFNPHPVIRGLWGPGRHENCHYLKFSLNLILGFHVILKNVTGCHSWRFLYSVAKSKNNYFEFDENCT